MTASGALRAEWGERNRLRPIHRVMTIAEDGVVLGAGTVLAPLDRSAGHVTGLVLDDAAEERLLALLAAAYRRPVELRVLGNIARASQHWRDGQLHLAAIEQALTGLPPLADEQEASYRLYLADQLIGEGVAPREMIKTLGIDPAALDRSKAGFNPAEPRVPAGNGIQSGDWTNGSGVTTIPVAARNPPATAAPRSGDPDKFFDTLYPQAHALAQRLGIDETWLLGLAAYESGWLGPHDRELNDPFGVTHGGGPNVAYGSIADAVAYWEKKYGPIVRGAASPKDFAQRLWEAKSNTRNKYWRNGVVQTINSIPVHLKSWK